MGLVLFEVPGIIRQRAVSEGGRGAVSAAVAVISTGNGTRANPHRGNWSCPRATEEDIVMDTNSKCENNKNTKKRLKSQEKSLEDIRLEDNNKIEQLLPWLLKFNKIIRSCTGSRNYEHLERLVFFYTQNILSSVAENTVEFNDKINLIKNHINKMLIFFHMYWLDIKQQNVDYSQYLNKISALLNVYIDMELKTSSHVVKDSSEVAAKILAALYIYLNNSEEHIFRILLRNTHTKKYTKVCNHIFMRSFTNLKTKTTSITDVAYIRYLLAFKIWRKMEETAKKLNLSDQKKRIDELALMLLGPRMPKLQDELLKFVPRPPIQEKNETLWLIESNQFDIKEFHKQFLLFEDKMDNSTGLKCTKTIHADQTCSKSQDRHDFPTIVVENLYLIILSKQISLCAQTFKICGKRDEVNLPLVHIPNELPYQTGEGSSAEIVAKKNSKSHSLRRVMELKDLEFGTREWIGLRPVTLEMHQDCNASAKALPLPLPLTALPRISSSTHRYGRVGARRGRFRDYDPGKVHRVTPSMTHRRNIAVIKTFGGYPAACMGFYPTTVSTSSLGFAELNFANAVCGNRHVMLRNVGI
ncbi:hypothetical protein ALC57_06106 [Trachymyrmex cornetzi]|uniref:Uncharacterized protein n=1 Tax=Trachymyrmex cornetzi TaxID=471704 RepID=A0A195E9K3_9HYME|nr:hypothetical protein ALC57_06106 [Trachymyrmex cornetzi]